MKGAIVIMANDRPEKELHILYDKVTKALTGLDGLRVVPYDFDHPEEVNIILGKMVKLVTGYRHSDNGNSTTLEEEQQSFKGWLKDTLKIVAKDVWYGQKGPPPRKETVAE